MTEHPDTEPTAKSARVSHQERAALSGGVETTSAPWLDNLAKRVVAGLPALVVLLLLIAVAPPRALALLAAAAAVYGTYEFTRLVAQGDGMRLPLGPMLCASVAIGLGGLAGTSSALNLGLLIGAAILVWTLWFAASTAGRDALRELSVGLAGLLMVSWLLNHVGLLVQQPGGRGFLAFLIVAISLNDTLAYLVGSFLGNWPLIPTVSPHKTVEGALGGVCGGAIAGVLARFWMGGEPVPFSLLALILLGALLAVAGQAGDLLESKLKRLTNADDSGSFLPGHGGLLDRADGYLLSAPLSFYLLRVLAG